MNRLGSAGRRIDTRGGAVLVIAMAFASVWGLLQLTTLGSITRSVRIGTLMLALATGLYGCGVVAVALQFGYTRLVAAVSGHPMSAVVRTASYTVDPFVEEIVKVAPILLLAWFTRGRWQRGLTDYLLLGAALGAGFGLLEALMRFGHRAGNAIAVPQGWVLPVSLSPPVIPGPGSALTSWFPAPVGNDSLFLLTDGPGTNSHLVWSAIAGLGIGLLVRGRGRVRLIGPVLVFLVGWDHAAGNYDLSLGHNSVGDLLSAPFVAAQSWLWLWGLIALITAVILDLRGLGRARGRAPALTLRRESAGVAGAAVLARYTKTGLPWTLLVVPRFVALRRAALYAHDPALARTPDPESMPLLDEVAAVRDQLDAADSHGAWRGVGRLVLGGDRDHPERSSSQRGRAGVGPLLRRFWPVLLWLLLLAPAFLFYVIGSTPITSGIQSVLGRRPVFVVLLVLPTLGGLVFLTWQLVTNGRALPIALRRPDTDPAARLLLRIQAGLGAAGFGLVVLGRWLSGTSPDSPVLSNYHVLDALSSLLLVAGFALVIAALVFFPPTIGLAVVATSAGTTILVPTIAVSSAMVTTGALGIGSIVLSQAARGANGPSGSGSGSGSSSGSQGPKGVEQHAEFGSFNEARDAARQSANLGDAETVDFVQKLGPYKGRVTGRQTSDGRRGWRIDYDERKGFHINWWDRAAGTKRAEWRYGANRIVNGTEDDYWKLLQHFPNS